MARARLLKPGFFHNEDLGELPIEGRLLFSGLWCLADREGRLEDRVRRIKIELFPYDPVDVDALLTALAERNFIIRYRVDGQAYIQIINFLKHQQPHYKEPASVIPPPPGHEDSLYIGGGVPEGVRQRVFDRDGRRCLECGATDRLSLDHIIPRSRGGTHDESNLRTLCPSCNSSKRNRDAVVSSSQVQPNVIPQKQKPYTEAKAETEAEAEAVNAAAAARPNIFGLYENLCGTITPYLEPELREAEDEYPPGWTEAAFQEAAEANVRKWKYVKAILRRWATDGFPAAEVGDGERGEEPEDIDKHIADRLQWARELAEGLKGGI